MITRPYKPTGEEISLLGFGAMRLPTVGKTEEIDYPRAKALVDEAYKAGVNYYDTAYFYHEGTSEAFMGKALAEYPRESYFLADKMPLGILDEIPQSPAEIFAGQLERCQTDYFDFYLFHCITESSAGLLESIDLWKLLDGYRKEGKIRKLGFSFHGGVKLLRQLAPKYNWDFAQIMYNYIDAEHTHAQEQYDILAENGIPCIVMEPLRGGSLAKLGSEPDAILKAAAPQRSIASWGMRWLLDKDNILCILSGMNEPEQLHDNLATLNESRPFSPEEAQALEKAAGMFLEYALIPCTSCRYCMPCPFGVDIPALFSKKNKHAPSGGVSSFLMEYRNFSPEHNAANCTACGACEKVCPQNIPISQHMQEICALVESE